MYQLEIKKESISSEIQKIVDDGFAKHAIETIGFDGKIEAFSFLAYANSEFVGLIKCKFFWGGLHIRRLFVIPSYRKVGIGTALLNAAEAYAKEHKCLFAFTETMSFQASKFYQQKGFVIEFSRCGYEKNTCFIYLKKNFEYPKT